MVCFEDNETDNLVRGADRDVDRYFSLIYRNVGQNRNLSQSELADDDALLEAILCLGSASNYDPALVNQVAIKLQACLLQLGSCFEMGFPFYWAIFIPVGDSEGDKVLRPHIV